MKILIVAPQPFFAERGSPIATKLLVESLCNAGYRVDLLIYHEGEELHLNRLKTFRIRPMPFVSNVQIGLSWKKILCDFYITIKLLHLLTKSCYRVVHAVEEAIFPALVLKGVFGFKLVYDMDSSMAEQIVGQYPRTKLILKPLLWLEKLAVRKADLVLPVCDSLLKKVISYAPKKNFCVLHDVPLFSKKDEESKVENLKKHLGIMGTIALYVGNLEWYQGIDLMLESFSLLTEAEKIYLIVIGGDKKKIRQYESIAARKGIDNRAHFIGSRPVDCIYGYLQQADILISPRVTGRNTPMKIFSYLASGKPIIATDIPSHTQVLDHSCSLLVKPEPQCLAKGILKLARNYDLCRQIGVSGKALVETKYSHAEYERKLLDSYAKIISKTK